MDPHDLNILPEPLRLPHPRTKGRTSGWSLPIFSGVALVIGYFTLFLGVACLVIANPDLGPWLSSGIVALGFVLIVLERVIVKRFQHLLDDERTLLLQEHIRAYMELLRPGARASEVDEWIDNTRLTRPPSPIFQPIFVFPAHVDGRDVLANAFLMANYILLVFSDEPFVPESIEEGKHEDYHATVPPRRDFSVVQKTAVAVATILSCVVFLSATVTVSLSHSYDDSLLTAGSIALLSSIPLLFGIGISYMMRKAKIATAIERRVEVLGIVSSVLEEQGFKAPVVDPEDMTSHNALGGRSTWLPLVVLSADKEYKQVSLLTGEDPTSLVLRVKDVPTIH